MIKTLAEDQVPPMVKIDQVLSHVFNYGDPDHSYPSIIKIGEVCNMEEQNGLSDMMKDLINIIQDNFGNNKVVVKLSEIMFSSPLISDDECRQATGPQSRSANTQTQEMNESRMQAKDFRHFLNLAFGEASTPGTHVITLSKLVCYLNLWVEKTIPKYPERNGVRKRVERHMKKVLDPVIEYLESIEPNDSEECNFEELMSLSNKPTFQSIQLNLIEAINNLT